MRTLNKVPQITIFFWIIKVLCTTVGETAADFLNTNLNLGLTNTAYVMTALLIETLVMQFALRRYVPGATPENAPYLDRLLTGAVAYYQDFVKASKKFRLPVGKEREALQDLADTLARLPEDSTAEFIQNEVYEAGKRHFAQAELRQWFKTLYEVLLGSEQGPRMCAFIKLYGRDNVVKRIERALAGEDLSRGA